MKVTVRDEAGVCVVCPQGRLDALASPDLSEALRVPVQSDQPRIVLDLSATPYVSSAGLRVIVQAAKQVMGRGKLAICGLTPTVRQVFELAGFDRILPLCTDAAAARAHVT